MVKVKLGVYDYAEMARFKGIVFDLDGTLIDSEVDFVKMKQNMIGVLEEHGVPKGKLTPQMTTVIIMENAEKYWSEQGKAESEKVYLRDEMTRIMDQGELEAISTLTVIPGVQETVKKLKQRGYKLAILTRSHHKYAEEALKKIGLEKEFDVILGRGETPQPKPYAEAMIYAAKALGLSLTEVVLVGDHHLDSTCAVNAKCNFIGVATGPRGDKSWEINRPNVILPSVYDIPEYLERNGL